MKQVLGYVLLFCFLKNMDIQDSVIENIRLYTQVKLRNYQSALRYYIITPRLYMTCVTCQILKHKGLFVLKDLQKNDQITNETRLQFLQSFDFVIVIIDAIFYKNLGMGVVCKHFFKDKHPKAGDHNPYL